MALSDSSDSTLLATYRTGLTARATPAERRDGSRAVVTLIERHRARAFSLRNRVTPSLSDETVEDVLLDAVLVKSRHERVFRLDGDAQYGTWLHRVLHNALVSALRKETYRRKNEIPLSFSAGDSYISRDDLAGVEDQHNFIADDALRSVLDTIDDLAMAHRDSANLARTFILRHLHEIAFPHVYSEKPGRTEVMTKLGVTEWRARALIEHADALLPEFRSVVAEKFGMNPPAAA